MGKTKRETIKLLHKSASSAGNSIGENEKNSFFQACKSCKESKEDKGNYATAIGKLHFNPELASLGNPKDDQKTILHYICESESCVTAHNSFRKFIIWCDEQRFNQKKRESFFNCQTYSTKSTPLHFAIKSNNIAIIEELLVHGADVNLREANATDDVMDLLFQKHPRVIRKFFNQKFVIQKHPQDEGNTSFWELNYNFTPIAGIKTSQETQNYKSSMCETWMLAKVLKRNSTSKQMILLHPLAQTFLEHKEKNMKIEFLLSFLLHMCWYSLAILFLWSDSDLKLSISLLGSTYILWVFAIIKEIFEIGLIPSFKRYVSQVENLGQWTLIVIVGLSGLFSFQPEWIKSEDLLAMNTVGIAVAGGLVQNQFANIDSLGIYIQTFIKVLHTLLWIFLSFAPTFVAFGYLFHQTFPKFSNNTRLETAFGVNKILAMMQGELTHDETFMLKASTSWVRKLSAPLAFFIFTMSINVVLQNLFLGWTISDMKELRKKALVNHLANRLEFMYLIERFYSIGAIFSSRLESIKIEERPLPTSVLDGNGVQLVQFKTPWKRLSENLRETIREFDEANTRL